MTTIRIRKNATRKLANLFAQATKFELETHSMRIDDSMESNGVEEITPAQFDVWFEANYSKMEIYAEYDENGEAVSVTFEGPYYFSDKVVVTFAVAEVETANDEHIQDEQTATEEKKPVATFAQVTEALKQGYISPLNNDIKKDSNVVVFPTAEKVDQDKNIKSIEITMSEGRILEGHKGRQLSLSEYQQLADRQVLESNIKDGCYDKTFVVVHLVDGRSFKFRHDVNHEGRLIAGAWSSWVDYVRKGKAA